MKKTVWGTSFEVPFTMLVLTLFWGCKQEVEKPHLPDFSCTKNRSINLQEELVTLKSDGKGTSGVPMNRVVQESNQNYLIEFNPSMHSLDYYSLKNLKLSKRVLFQKEGPNALPIPMDFCWHNQDSIFFLGEGGVFSMMNDQGILKRRIILSTQLPNGMEVGDYYAEPTMGLRVDYIAKIKSIQLYIVMLDGNPEYNKSLPFIANYSLPKNKITHMYGIFPEAYLKGQHFSLFDDPSKIVVQNKTIVSFGPDRGMYVYDAISGNLEKAVCAASENFSSTKGLPHGVAEYQDLINFETSEPWYLKVIYDPYRKRYYRFAKQRQELKDADGKMNPRFFGKWSIIVLDQDYKCLGEVQLPAKKYAILSSFVAPQGLMILNLNQTNENEKTFYQLNFE